MALFDSYRPPGLTKVHPYNMNQAYGFANSSEGTINFVIPHSAGDFSPLIKKITTSLSSEGTEHFI
jgi:hypothetical protein